MGKKLTIEDCKRIAEERGGECLSTEYKDNKTHMLWKCSYGHEWSARFFNIKIRNQWCPECNGNIRLNIQDCKKIAADYSGECLSDNYINNRTKLKWKCKEGHEWLATFGNIKTNHWCPNCKNKTEQKVREILEDMFQLPFPSVWFYDHTFQIDCYCESLKLGVEYDGEHHYFSKSYCGGDNALIKRKELDNFKNNICKEMGISLIRIPYYEKHRLKDFISEIFPPNRRYSWHKI